MLVIRAGMIWGRRLEAYRGRHHRVQYEYFVPELSAGGYPTVPAELGVADRGMLERDGGVEPAWV